MKSDIVIEGLRFPGKTGTPWGWLANAFRNRCPYCKCLDLWHYAHEDWVILENGKRVRLGHVECRACHKRWDWDDDGR